VKRERELGIVSLEEELEEELADELGQEAEEDE
jgi:hypothetical protein